MSKSNQIEYQKFFEVFVNETLNHMMMIIIIKKNNNFLKLFKLIFKIYNIYKIKPKVS